MIRQQRFLPGERVESVKRGARDYYRGTVELRGNNSGEVLVRVDAHFAPLFSEGRTWATDDALLSWRDK